jgi:hypothetical protein
VDASYFDPPKAIKFYNFGVRDTEVGNMEFVLRDRNHVREILRASEGIPSQFHTRVELTPFGQATSGHALTRHLHSVDEIKRHGNTTKFLSMDDMVDALWLALQTPAAGSLIKNLPVGEQKDIWADVPRVFGIECRVHGPQWPQGRVVKFTERERRQAGYWNTSCVAVLEGRERAGRAHLQIHTFYPVLSQTIASSLLSTIRNDPAR